MMGTSPPGPFGCGSATCKVNAVATAASKALPPFSRTAMPTAVAIQCVEATTPKVPSISGRVVNGLGLMNFMPATWWQGRRLSAGSTVTAIAFLRLAVSGLPCGPRRRDSLDPQPPMHDGEHDQAQHRGRHQVIARRQA